MSRTHRPMGVIEAYVDPQHRIGALVELRCETDFVARTKEIHELAQEVAFHVAATDPETVGSIEEISQDNQALLNQEYVRNVRRTIRDLMNEMISTVGERVWIERFIRWETPQFRYEW